MTSLVPACHPKISRYPIGELRCPAPLSTLEEEWSEVLESVLQSLAAEEVDVDRMAACSRLLQHLTRAAARTPGSGRIS